MDIGLAIAQTALLLTMLAYQAWLMMDAIIRTLWRMGVTHRNLLEWIPADLLSSARADFAGFYSRMLRGVALAAAAALIVVLVDGPYPSGVLPPLAFPFLLAWLAAPAVAWRISKVPVAAAKSELDDAQQSELRLIGRRTWRFFDTFVTA
jgi:cyclic beta-1,2-glucan synthetase